MMHLLYYVFWISLGIIFYNYIGYAVLLLVVNGIGKLFGRNRAPSGKGALPAVTLVVAAYNEEAVIKDKIENCLELDYPKDKLAFLFVIDGSEDGSADIIAQYPQIYLMDSPERKGKTAALNRAMQRVQTPITIFCDANTILNRSAVKKIVRHYEDIGTGGVAGEKRIMTKGSSRTPAEGEGLYWRYESFLKRLDSELYTVTGAAGELFSVRTALWKPLPQDVILDDFVISTRINLRGYRIAYEPEAFALELPSASLDDEKKRKVRIAAGAFQAMALVKPVFNCFRHPLLFFQFFSHRFMRWTLTPLSLPILLVTNVCLAAYQGGPIYITMLVGQLLFYLMAIAGWVSKQESGIVKGFKICYYILFMNYSVYLGFFRFLCKKQPAVWEKAERVIAVEVII